MTDEDWPFEEAEYDAVVQGEAETSRWQQAIDAALKKRELRLEPREADGVYDLVGSCPRCGHEMQDDVHFRVIGNWWGRARRDPVRQNIVCNCKKTHGGRPGDKAGCGWAPDIEVSLTEPFQRGNR
jgi:hypothetical protein